MSKKVVSINMDDTANECLNYLSKIYKRSRSQVVNMLIEEKFMEERKNGRHIPSFELPSGDL